MKSKKDEIEETTKLYMLVTVVQGCIMAACYSSKDKARLAAVAYIQTEAATFFGGKISERYSCARRHVTGQGGLMEIIPSILF